jgi:class 3 adenylate cyclase
VNLSQRLQDMARPGGRTIMSEATWSALSTRPEAVRGDAELVKGRSTPVATYCIEPHVWQQ